jgi:hypothetical protein
VTAIAGDPFGTIETNYAGSVTFTSSDSDPNVVLPADYTFTSSDAGVVMFPDGATLFTEGDQTITATDTVTGIKGTATVTVVPSQAPSGTNGPAGAIASATVHPRAQAAPVWDAFVVGSGIADLNSAVTHRWHYFLDWSCELE